VRGRIHFDHRAFGRARDSFDHVVPLPSLAISFSLIRCSESGGTQQQFPPIHYNMAFALWIVSLPFRRSHVRRSNSAKLVALKQSLGSFLNGTGKQIPESALFSFRNHCCYQSTANSLSLESRDSVQSNNFSSILFGIGKQGTEASQCSGNSSESCTIS